MVLFSERVRHIQESLEQFIESLNNEKEDSYSGGAKVEQRSEIFCTFSLSLDLDLLWTFLVRRQGEDEAA